MSVSSDPEQQLVYDRFTIRLAEVNILLRALSMGGTFVRLDVIERKDPVTGNDYSYVIVDGIPGGLNEP